MFRRLLHLVVAVLAVNMTIIAQTAPRLILAGNQLQPPFDLGIDTSGQNRDWVFPGPGYLRLAFPAAQQWAALFITVGPPVDRSRPFVDLSAFDTIQVEMRSDGPVAVEVGLKTNTQLDDGNETKRGWTLGSNWQARTFRLSEFTGADPRRLYVVLEVVYSGSTAQTVYLRGVRYTKAAGFPCLKSPPQIAAWWPGDGDAADIAGAARTDVGPGVTFQSGIVGQAFSFDGRAGVLTVPSTKSLEVDANVPFTVETWVNPASTSSASQYLAGKMEGCNPDSDMLQMSIGPLGFPASSIAPGVWSHLAMVVDRGTASFYVNGAMTVQRPLFTTRNTLPWLIGGTGTCPTFRGLLDEVIVHSRTLSLQEINDEYGIAGGGRCKARVASVVNAASGAGGPLAPASLVTLFASDLAELSATASGARLPTELANLSVIVIDSSRSQYNSGLAYVSSDQINLSLPAVLANGPATITVSRPGEPPISAALLIDSVAPGLFSANGSGKGVAAAVIQRVSPSGQATTQLTFVPETKTALPIEPAGADRLYLLLFGTGFRLWRNSVSATIGGQEVPVLGAVAQGEFDGLDQLNLGPLPSSLTGRGETTISVKADGKQMNPVSIVFR